MIKTKLFLYATIAAAVGGATSMALAAPVERPIVLAQEGKAAGGSGGGGGGMARGGGGGPSVGSGGGSRSTGAGTRGGDRGRPAMSEGRRSGNAVERSSPRVRDSVRSERRVDRESSRRRVEGTREGGERWRDRRGDGDRSRPWRSGKRFHWGPGIDFWFYDGYYYGDCSWLRRKAIDTGSRYWWQRYRVCRAAW